MNQPTTPYECVVLAGGLGTRLQNVVSDVPKVLAPVAGKPFLHHLFLYLKKNNISRVIMSVGYKYEMIEEYCFEWKDEFDFAFAVEKEPLGTGGGIRLAMLQAKSEHVFIVNGDTYFNISLASLAQHHLRLGQSDMSIALKRMENFDRYGIVQTNADNHITGFAEKQFREYGLINGGIYIIRKNCLFEFTFPEKFSFEKDFMETHYNFLHFHGFNFDDYFIDIGVPEDYARANTDLIYTAKN